MGDEGLELKANPIAVAGESEEPHSVPEMGDEGLELKATCNPIAAAAESEEPESKKGLFRARSTGAVVRTLEHSQSSHKKSCCSSPKSSKTHWAAQAEGASSFDSFDMDEKLDLWLFDNMLVGTRHFELDFGAPSADDPHAGHSHEEVKCCNSESAQGKHLSQQVSSRRVKITCGRGFRNVHVVVVPTVSATMPS